MDLNEDRIYRIARGAVNPELRGRLITFHGWRQEPWDIRRAIVRLVEPRTDEHVEWLVNQSIITNV